MAITNDTRVRNISDEDVKKLKKLSNVFGINTTTGVLLNLIPEYFDNQSSIRTLEKKNTKLEGELSEVLGELANLKASIKTFLEMEEKAKKQKKFLLSEV